MRRLRRLTLALSVGFTFAAFCACAGGEAPDGATDGAGEDGADGDKEIVIVPVDGGAGPHHCCAITEDGKDRHALARGPAECKNRLGGEWVEGPMCIPCCCKSPHDPADLEKGYTYELTTPGSCAGAGECVTDDVPECPQNRREAGGGGDEGAQPEPEQPKPRPRPRPTPRGPSGARPK